MTTQFGTYKEWTICLINLLSLSLAVLPNADGSSSTTPTVPTTTPETTQSSSFSQRLIIRRNHRVMSIVQSVMDNFGWLTVPTVESGARNRFLNSIVEDNRSPSLINNMTVVQEMCYPAKCTGNVPVYINRDSWNAPDSMSMNLFFDVLQSMERSTRVRNATLYLFIKSRSDCGCEDSQSEDDVQLIVAVYQYYPDGHLLPRTRGRLPNGQRIRSEVTVNSSSRRRRLSVKLIQWQRRESVVDFDVTDAVNFWVTRRQEYPEYSQRRGRHRSRSRSRRFQRRFRANFGLEVTVNEYLISRQWTSQYNASNVFTDADCNLPFDVRCMVPEIATRLRPTPVLNVWTETRPILTRNKRNADEQRPAYGTPTTQSTLDKKTLNDKKDKGEDSAGKT